MPEPPPPHARPDRRGATDVDGDLRLVHGRVRRPHPERRKGTSRRTLVMARGRGCYFGRGICPRYPTTTAPVGDQPVTAWHGLPPGVLDPTRKKVLTVSSRPAYLTRARARERALTPTSSTTLPLDSVPTSTGARSTSRLGHPPQARLKSYAPSHLNRRTSAVASPVARRASATQRRALGRLPSGLRAVHPVGQ